MLAPFSVRSFRFQWPADLATSWSFEMETLILGWYVLVAVGLSHSRVLPWLQRHAHWINRMTGVLLIALALRVVAGPII